MTRCGREARRRRPGTVRPFPRKVHRGAQRPGQGDRRSRRPRAGSRGAQVAQAHGGGLARQRARPHKEPRCRGVDRPRPRAPRGPEHRSSPRHAASGGPTKGGHQGTGRYRLATGDRSGSLDGVAGTASSGGDPRGRRGGRGVGGHDPRRETEQPPGFHRLRGRPQLHPAASHGAARRREGARGREEARCKDAGHVSGKSPTRSIRGEASACTTHGTRLRARRCNTEETAGR